MRKWRLPLIIVVTVLLLSVLLFFVPLDNIYTKIPLLNTFYKNTSLEITTPNGKALVEINDKEYGETPVTVQELVAGKYEIELNRVSTQEGFYTRHIFNIELTKNTTSRINVEIGPGDNLNGFLLYYQEENSLSGNSGQITITSDATDAKIYLDDEYLDTTPLTNLELPPKEYTITIRATGYEDLTFPVIVESGHILNIKGYQFPVPITFENVQTNE
jgi:hypothetical protein